MAQVIVRNLRDEIVERLKTKAELKGHSLEQELRDILEAAAPLTAEEKIEMFRRIRALTPKDRVQTPSEDLIREGRDNDESYR